ncbi:MAG TPA: hypothetical protein VMI53_09885, partial [Opitutaceae bacterium]|nr:hypothetical protein [Opitutaceae bacterium]
MQNNATRSGSSIHKNSAVGLRRIPDFSLRLPGRCAYFFYSSMSDFNSDSLPEGEWDERGELAWNEFDWEN